MVVLWEAIFRTVELEILQPSWFYYKQFVKSLLIMISKLYEINTFTVPQTSWFYFWQFIKSRLIMTFNDLV